MFDRLNALLDRFQELEQSIAEPEIIQNYEKYQSILKELSSLEPLIGKYTDYLSVTRQLREARELLSDPLMADEAASEISVLTKQQNALTNELKILLVPPDPMDSRNVILEIRAGVGGEEAALFAGDLLRMYQKYADKSGLAASILSYSDTDLGGINEAILTVTGPDAFAKMKFESGVHCVKRVPVTRSPLPFCRKRRKSKWTSALQICASTFTTPQGTAARVSTPRTVPSGSRICPPGPS